MRGTEIMASRALLILLLERLGGGFQLRRGSGSDDDLADSTGDHFRVVKMNPVSAVARHQMSSPRGELCQVALPFHGRCRMMVSR
jgi:hypothetical protein